VAVMNIKQTSLTEIQNILAHIPADLPYDEWIKCIMAVKSTFGEAGFTLVDEWSKSSSKYSSKVMSGTWKSIHIDGPVGLGTLFYMAKIHGYQDNDADYSNLMIIRKSTASNILLDEINEIKKKKSDQNIAARKCINRWLVSSDCNESHTYLIEKKVNAFGIKQLEHDLLVPIRDVYDVLWSLQVIYPNGAKRFAKGGRLKGCFCPIGEIGEIVNVCEGWATGATYHQLANEFVACAMTSGNLKEVAIELKKKYPDKRIRIIADNDRFTKNNPGVTKAIEAAQSVGGEYYIPAFSDEEDGTDFNDFAILRGLLND